MLLWYVFEVLQDGGGTFSFCTQTSLSNVEDMYNTLMCLLFFVSTRMYTRKLMLLFAISLLSLVLLSVIFVLSLSKRDRKEKIENCTIFTFSLSVSLLYVCV